VGLCYQSTEPKRDIRLGSIFDRNVDHVAAIAITLKNIRVIFFGRNPYSGGVCWYDSISVSTQAVPTLICQSKWVTWHQRTCWHDDADGQTQDATPWLSVTQTEW